MRIFKTKLFHRWAIKERLSEATLTATLKHTAGTLAKAHLGGHVYKMRIRLPGRGKSGGARTLLAYEGKGKAFFVYGYAKNERENIDDRELNALKELAANLLGYTEAQLLKAIGTGELKEIQQEGKKNE
jgi:hypothetical protein